MAIILDPFFVSDVTICRMLDKTGQTGSPLQLVNGLILISTFACARLCYGFIIVRVSSDLRAQGFLGYLTARILVSHTNFSKRYSRCATGSRVPFSRATFVEISPFTG
jgi:hypothetical protein